MKKIVYVIASLLLIPLVVSAETFDIGYNGAFYSGCGESSGQGPSALCQRYSIKGENATCIDADNASPDIINTSHTYKVNEDTFGDGLIAMANYAKINGISEIYQAHAFRIYTMKVNPLSGGGVIGSGTRQAMINYSSSDQIGTMVKVGLCAAENKCDGVDDINKYLPNNDSSSTNLEFEIEKSGQDDPTTSGKNITVVAHVSINKENADAKIIPNKSCKANGFKCSVESITDDGFDVKISGTKGKNSSIKVEITFSGVSGNTGDMITEVTLYSCTGSCITKTEHQGRRGPYQRFIQLVSGKANSSDSKKTIEVTLPTLCDDPNMSDEEKTKNGCCNVSDEFIKNLEEGSEEEDNYIKACGPIIHLENDCGADSCSKDGELNKSSYRAFNHSFIRGRSMKYLMLELGKLETKANWNDYEPYFEQSFNDYCATFITENVDIYTPGTAASISGQFFIFDSYNDSNASSNVNSYFRQPYVVDKTKRTFFFNSNAWNKDYKQKAAAEQKSYETWQTSIDNLLSANKTLIDAKNNYEKMKSHSASCHRKQNIYNEKGDIVSSYTDWDACIADAESVYNSATSRFNSAVSAEEGARTSYGSAVSARTQLQGIRNTCMEEIKKFQMHYKNEKIPDVSFSYKQNSKKYDGVTENTIDMIEADKEKGSVKYWPNTSSGVDDGNYISGKCGGEYANMVCTPIYNDPTGSGYAEDHLQGITPTMVPTRVNGHGNIVTKLGDENTMTETEKKYQLPYPEIDGCSGGDDKKNCQEYFFNNVTFNAKQGIASDGAKDPYDNYTNSVDTYEKVSKYTFYRPPKNTFALMNTGEYLTPDNIKYDSNSSMKNINGLEIGYVYNIELTSYKGQYETKFTFKDIKYQNDKLNDYFNSKLSTYLTENDMVNVYSTCNYCNMEMAFRRNCDECDDTQNYDFVPQFYYRAIALSDVTPTERENGETNWSDAKGQAAEALIQQGSGLASLNNNDNNNYIALTSDADKTNKADDSKLSTYLADSSSSGKYDIYDDESRKYLEYEVTLTTKDLQTIKRNTAKKYFKYSKMNMCGTGTNQIGKDSDIEYCFDCNSDMKECKSTFVESYFSDKSGRDNKWKYYVNGKFCTGSISSCIKGLDYIMVDSSGNTVGNKDGIYPDPLYPQKFLEQYKNWP